MNTLQYSGMLSREQYSSPEIEVISVNTGISFLDTSNVTNESYPVEETDPGFGT